MTDWNEYGRELKKKWYWLLASVVVCAVAGCIYYAYTAPSYYVSSAIMLRVSADNGNTQDEMMKMMGLGGPKVITDEVEILRSRSLMEQVIETLDLLTEYRKKGCKYVNEQYPFHDLTVEFAQKPTCIVRMSVKVKKGGYVIKTRTCNTHSVNRVKDLSEPLSTCVGEVRLIANEKMEKGAEYCIITYPMNAAVEKYSRQISVTKLSREANVIKIGTTSKCPQKSMDMINMLVDLYNEQSVLDKNLVAINSAKFIDERLCVISGELNEIENQIEAYKKSHRISDLEASATYYMQRGDQYQQRLDDIDTQLEVADYVEKFVSDDSNKNSAIPANLGISDKTLESLVDKYNEQILRRLRIQRSAGEENPVLQQVDEQLNVIRESILTNIGNIRESLKIQKQSVSQTEWKYSSRLASVPEQERRYLEITREQQIKEQLFMLLNTKKEETNLLLSSTVIPAKTIDRAGYNPTPVTPKLKMIMLLALVFGLAIPMGCLYIMMLPRGKKEED